MKSLQFEHFGFRYMHQKNKALEDITFDVEEGIVVGILGPAGAGKSTLIKALNGLVPNVDIGYQDGDVSVYDMNTRQFDVNQMAHHVAMVLQNPEIQIFSVKVWDDIAFGPANLGVPREEIRQRVAEALAETGLEGFTNRNPNELSGGEQQALAIAGLLAMKPRVMAFDEPVSMLDPLGKEKVMQIMRQVTRKLSTTSLATESGADIEAIAEAVDHLILLDKGKLVMEGTPREVLSSELIGQVGVGRPQVTEIFLELARRGHPIGIVPITLDEAVEQMCTLLHQVGIKHITRPPDYPIESERNFGETVVSVKNLHHFYNADVHALKGVSLEIPKGQIVGIIGQNGSGKTTLARHLVGLLKPSNKDSQILVKGIDIAKKRISEIITMINYVFQNPDDQLFAETIYDEVAFAPKMMDLKEDDIKRLTEEALQVFDLTQMKNWYVYSLDEDLKTYLAITCILPMHPDILLIDEPTTGLDTLGEIKMMDSLRRLRDEQGKTIVIITHNMKTIGNHCDRVIVMTQGNIILDGTPREIFIQDEKLLEADIRPPQVTRFGQMLADEFGCPRDILSVEEMVAVLDYSMRIGER